MIRKPNEMVVCQICREKEKLCFCVFWFLKKAKNYAIDFLYEKH